jgi:predicted MFS family arabinose efflux permease
MNRRNYIVVTAAYWGFTLTDGALRMLVLLHFAQQGYSALRLATLFLSYEFFGIGTNLFGGWLASRLGLRVTLLAGLGLQVVALGMLAELNPSWTAGLLLGYVMAAQALSGIAKDLTKMSSKSAIKVLVSDGEAARRSLFRWVAILTGSKNALKGVGFFLGGILLSLAGFTGALWIMAAGLVVTLTGAWVVLPAAMGKTKQKSGWRDLFAKSQPVNVLSAARFFLFGARDIWFVVGVPVFLSASLGWSGSRVGAFMASWVIGYGVVQSLAPALLRGREPTGRVAAGLAFVLAAVAACIPLLLGSGVAAGPVIVAGLAVFGAVFALNSAVHSYLILDYTDGDKVALNVGFYYMANAGGRLMGCLLSGVLFQLGGLAVCLWGTFVFAVAAGVIALWLPQAAQHPGKFAASAASADGGGE